jgi:hypothetical protein
MPAKIGALAGSFKQLNRLWPKAVSARRAHNREDQKFAPSCSDAHERLSQALWRHPMFGAIFDEIRS